MRSAVLLMCAVAFSSSYGQETRPTPQTRQTLPQEAPLPSIRLPEYVITGKELIDLPPTEKATTTELVSGTPALRPAQPSVDRPAAGPREDMGQTVGPNRDASRIGTLSLSLGSFSTLDALANGSGFVGDVYVAGGARYGKTTGFAPWTSGSSFSSNASTMFPTTLFSGAVRNPTALISGEVRTRTYRWYGTARPSDTRTTSMYGVQTGLSGLAGGHVPAQLTIGFRGMSVVDTSTTVGQSEFTVRGDGNGSLFGQDIRFWADILTGGTTGGAGGSVGRFGVGAEMQVEVVENISSTLSLEAASIVGQGGQKRTLLIPGVRVSFGFAEKHRFIGRFAPGPVYRNLASLTEEVPFIDASTPLRHSIHSTRGSIGIESDWSGDVRSAFELEASRISDYPVLADTGARGVIQAFYGDVTETLIRASAVAKLFSNHYFSAIAIIRSSNNSSTGASLPNIPSAEVRLGHQVQLTEQMKLESEIQFISSRETTLGGLSAKADGYVRTDVKGSYLLLPGLEFFVGFRNLFDSHIEYWRGYRETPFTIVIGASYTL